MRSRHERTAPARARRSRRASARRCRTTRRRCTSPARRCTRTTCPSRATLLHVAVGREPDRARHACAASILRTSLRRPASSRSSPPPTSRASTTSARSSTTIPIFAHETVEFVGQPVFAVAATDVRLARRAAKLAKLDLEPLPAILTIDDALAAQSYVLPPVHVTRGDAAAALARAPHRLRGTVRARRPGPLLPRRPDRDGDPARARRDADLHVDAASGRGAAHGRACARHRRARRGGRVPAHGRRLRRQGNADVAVRLRCRARRAQDRARRQAAPRPRRRHALDRQAPRVRVLVRRRLRRATAASSASTSRSRRAAGSRPTCRGRSTTAPCSTRTTRTGCPTSRCTASAARPTPCRTPRFAASAARRACSRSST